MLKLTAIMILMLIGMCVCLSCDSCGQECAHACGTRLFRSCCFNYLRRKRGPDMLDNQDWMLDLQTSKPLFTRDLSWETQSHPIIF